MLCLEANAKLTQVVGNVFYSRGRFMYQRRENEAKVDLGRMARLYRYNVEPLSKALGISRRQLYRDFVRGIGLSPKEWLQHQRVQAGIRMIDEGQKLDTVASSLGFSSYDKFYREIKRHIEFGPKAFQTRSRDWPKNPLNARGRPKRPATPK